MRGLLKQNMRLLEQHERFLKLGKRLLYNNRLPYLV